MTAMKPPKTGKYHKEVLVMSVDYKTDAGKRRPHNEDSIIVDHNKGIFLLADGMGGHQAGEIASKMAVEVAYDYLLNTVRKTSSKKKIFESLKSAILRAHEVIKLSAESNEDFTGMGTTLVLMIVKDDRAYICHAGDSRAYLIREKINQITTDQTWANHLIKNKKVPSGKIPAQASHVLTQAVGVSSAIVPELKEIRLMQEDVMLLCSDGLTDMLKDHEIKSIVEKYRHKDFNKTAPALVRAANYRGGRDNISVVLMKYRRSKIEVECTVFSF